MLLLIALLTVQGPTPDVCRRLTSAQVAPVLGSAPAKPGKSVLPGTCTWSVPGRTLTVSAVDLHDAGAAAAMVGASRGAARKGDTVKDETGIGQAAISTVAGNGRTVELLVASGPVLWRYVVEGGDTAVKAEATLAALRTLARKPQAGRV